MEIPPNTYLCEFTGELVRSEIADIREKMYFLKRKEICCSLQAKGSKSCYFFRLNNKYIIDATTKGNEARFINHSCNVYEFQSMSISSLIPIRMWLRWMVPIILCLFLFTRSFPIKKLRMNGLLYGNGHRYDYKFSHDGEEIPCTCGADNCRGRMNWVFSSLLCLFTSISCHGDCCLLNKQKRAKSIN